MDPRCRDAIDNTSVGLCQALLEDIPRLLEQGLRLDALVRDLRMCTCCAWTYVSRRGGASHRIKVPHNDGPHGMVANVGHHARA